ncbi:hypothetical protein E2980_02270 [Cohnella luojiensis]|uniref:Oxidoreductase molybdopterin-binding domain-containing protein n=2 Tax=Cohnella luojiensis TaxID=652876 RepID=A0A4Y8M700_9BACL|nr:hypothetical protein E2980_02270 [Cohnella luojiensis]
MPNDVTFTTTPLAMAELSGEAFPVEARVPGAVGEGFDLRQWYSAFRDSLMESPGEHHFETPTHLTVRAADEFQATIPWNQLSGSLLQYAIEGQPLSKGYPIRLYVPDGTSACLNVKSVTTLRFIADAALGDEAIYGFLNEIAPSQLSKGLKSR